MLEGPWAYIIIFEQAEAVSQDPEESVQTMLSVV